MNTKKISFGVILSLFTALFVFGSLYAEEVLIFESDQLSVIRGDDASENISLSFGDSLSHFLQWDASRNIFVFSDDVDFTNHEIKNVRLENIDTAPLCDSTLIGKLYYDTIDSSPYICDGTQWTALTNSLTVAQTIDVINTLNNIYDSKQLALNGKAAETLKICPYGTDVSTNVASYEDGNIVYIKRNGSAEYEVLARLDKGEVHTFLASQGDRVYSLKGDSVIGNAFGTIAWPSLAMAGKEFFTYVSRNASAGSPAKAYVVTFAADTHLVVEKDGGAYYDEVLPKESVTEVDLNDLAEFYFKADQEISIWYIGNNFSNDAKPLPPVSTELLWWITSYNTDNSPRVSALYDTTELDIKYRSGASQTNTINPGSPLVMPHSASISENYNPDAATWIRADGIISGSNTSDTDGSNGTSWLSPDIAAQHFVLPNNAEHISFISEFEGNIKVFDETDSLVTTIDITRSASVASDQSYPSAVRYNFSGTDGKGYRFESTVPVLAVFDNNESGLAGDETILLGGSLPERTNANPIYEDLATGQRYQLRVINGIVSIEEK